MRAGGDRRSRGAEYLPALKQQISQAAFYAINPNILGANYSLPKLLWLREHDARLYEQADFFLLWGDMAGFMLGAGIVQAGRAVCGIGSFECITPTYDRIPEAEPMLRNGLNVEHHVIPGLYVSFLYNQAGTLVKWFRNTFAGADRKLASPDSDLYTLLNREIPPAPTRLFTLPYFEMTGPPDFVADASGVIAGLKTSTTRGEILKSIMECATFYFVDSLAALGRLGINTSEFIATGGGARSDAWLQIKADILGVPFIRPRITEGSVPSIANAMPSIASFFPACMTY